MRAIARPSRARRRKRGECGGHVEAPADERLPSARRRARGHREEVRPVRRPAQHHAVRRLRRVRLLPGPQRAAARPRSCASSPASSARTPASCAWPGATSRRLPPALRNYGIVFQSYALFPNLTVARNVAYGLETRRDARKPDIERAGGRAAGPGRPRAAQAQVPGPALGRRAAARRARPGAGALAGAAAARRAALGPRRPGAPVAAPRDPRSSSAGSASPPSWSPTIRKRRWPWPTASW